MALLGQIPSNVPQTVPPRNPYPVRPYHIKRTKTAENHFIFWAAYLIAEHRAFKTRHMLPTTGQRGILFQVTACFPLHLFKKTKEAEYGGYRLWSTRWSEHLAEGKGLAALQWLLICHSCCDSTAYLSFLKGFYFWMPSSSRMYLVIILPDS